MTTIAHGGNPGSAAEAAPEGISRLFPEEHAAGLDAMDAVDTAATVREVRNELDALGPMDREDIIAAAVMTPAPGAYAYDLADPSAEEDFDAVLAALDAGDDPGDPDGDPPLAGGDLGHAGHEPLPEEHFSAAAWEAT